MTSNVTTPVNLHSVPFSAAIASVIVVTTVTSGSGSGVGVGVGVGVAVPTLYTSKLKIYSLVLLRLVSEYAPNTNPATFPVLI